MDRYFTDKQKAITVFGILLIAWWFFDFYLKVFGRDGNWYAPLWFCSLMLLLGGVALLTKSQTLVTAVLALALIFQIPWIVDYLSIIIFDYPLKSGAGYITKLTFVEFINTIRHLLIIPIMFFGWLTLWKPARYSFVITTVLLISVGLISRNAPPILNINCAHEICIVPVIGRFALGPYILLVLSVVVAAFLTQLLSDVVEKTITPKKIYWSSLRAMSWLAFCLILLGVVKFFLL